MSRCGWDHSSRDHIDECHRCGERDCLKCHMCDNRVLERKIEKLQRQLEDGLSWEVEQEIDELKEERDDLKDEITSLKVERFKRDQLLEEVSQLEDKVGDLKDDKDTLVKECEQLTIQKGTLTEECAKLEIQRNVLKAFIDKVFQTHGGLAPNLV